MLQNSRYLNMSIVNQLVQCFSNRVPRKAKVPQHIEE
jgi:hypothetical protein